MVITAPVTAELNAAPWTSCPPPKVSVSPAQHRFSASPASAPTAAAANTRSTPGSASPTWTHNTPNPPRSPRCCAGTGISRTGCTGSVTSPSAKTHPKSAPAPHPEPWLPCATSPSTPYGSTAPPTSPKPYAPWPATSPDHYTCSASHPDQHRPDFDGALTLSRGPPSMPVYRRSPTNRLVTALLWTTRRVVGRSARSRSPGAGIPFTEPEHVTVEMHRLLVVGGGDDEAKLAYRHGSQDRSTPHRRASLLPAPANL